MAVAEKKKRGRKPNKLKTDSNLDTIIPDQHKLLEPPAHSTDTNVHKKRGRKPKGGKILTDVAEPLALKDIEPNIILHLKCNMSDLHKSVEYGEMDSFQFDKSKGVELLCYDLDLSPNNSFNKEEPDCEKFSSFTHQKENSTEKPIRYLSNAQHLDKKSDCFWDTCPFSGNAINIPTSMVSGKYKGYGVFCMPECAAAYLFNEQIDTTVKFERYAMLNNAYARTYNTNIIPSANPHYTLDKYLGNLTIDEYRKISTSGKLVTTLNYPMSRIMPELCEFNNDTYVSESIKNSHKFKIKRKAKADKSEILNNKFNIQYTPSYVI